MVSYIVGIGITVIFAAVISLFWAKGVVHMQENHPDYKGEDFLNWGGEYDDWDNINHTENEI